MTPRRTPHLAFSATMALLLAASMTMIARTAQASTPIKHVVFIFQENHSFDNLLGVLCVQQTRCDGTTSGTLYGGQSVALSQAKDLVPNVCHSVNCQRIAVDGGKMDGFSKIVGCNSTSNYACYSQFKPSQIPNVAALAHNFAISDRTFEENLTPSWGAHLDVVAATMDGFIGAIPAKSAQSSNVGGWGCDSFDVTAWVNPANGAQSTVPSCVPDQNGGGPFEPSPVQHVRTIMDSLSAGGLTWKLYTGSPGAGNTTGYGWAVCPSFADCIYSSAAQNMVPNADVVTDAQNGLLPSFSIVTPNQANSQHNFDSMTVGDNWIGQVVSAIENGPDWNSTAIFLSWDDCGCFYDHVAPPSKTHLGLRVPMIIVSPYAVAGFTDHNTASFSSVLAYTESIFGLPPLSSSSHDNGAYDFADSFNYAQAPLPGVKLGSHPISSAERQAITANPPDPNDPS